MGGLQNLESLILHLRDYISKNVPGMAQLLNMLCTSKYRVSCLDLFRSSPSRLYYLILEYYRSDYPTADYVFTLLFLNPIARLTGSFELLRALLDYAKTGRDRDFVELLLKYISKKGSKFRIAAL